MNYFCFTLFGLSFFSCISDDDRPSLDNVDIDFMSTEMIDIEKNNGLEILQLFSNDNIYIDQFRYMIVTDEYFLFYDSDFKIHIYDLLLNHINTIHKIGKGSGEYLSIAGLSLSEKASEFYITDTGNKKILRMDINGDIIDEVSTKNWIKNGNRFSKNKKLYVGATLNSNILSSGKNFGIVLFDGNDDLKEGYFEFSEPNSFGMGNGHQLIRLSDEHFGYYHTYSNSIYHIYEDRIEDAYTFTLPKPVLPENLVLDHMRGNIELDEYSYFLSYFENKNYLVLTYNLDRDRYWSVLEKKSKMTHSYIFKYQEECTGCNKIYTIGLDSDGIIVVVGGSALLRLDKDLESTITYMPQDYDIEYEDFLIRLKFP